MKQIGSVLAGTPNGSPIYRVTETEVTVSDAYSKMAAWLTGKWTGNMNAPEFNASRSEIEAIYTLAAGNGFVPVVRWPKSTKLEAYFLEMPYPSGGWPQVDGTIYGQIIYVLCDKLTCKCSTFWKSEIEA